MSIQEHNPLPDFETFRAEKHEQHTNSYKPNCRSAKKRTAQCVGHIDGKEVVIYSQINLCKTSKDAFLQRAQQTNQALKTQYRLRKKLADKNQSKQQDDQSL